MRSVSFTLNGKPTRLTVDETRPLLWVLRDDLGLSGTKFGCGEGLCGSCTVVVDGKAVRSCTTAVGDVAGKKVITIEGLGADKLHPIQEAFVKHDAFQCGFCTPGMIMGAYALLLENPKADHAAIVKTLDDHLCRCGAHPRILQAVESVAAGRAAGAVPRSKGGAR
jgi:aerobic-type carbon monoxide dehydrogenase small subunit (CoxS/CutS family)